MKGNSKSRDRTRISVFELQDNADHKSESAKLQPRQPVQNPNVSLPHQRKVELKTLKDGSRHCQTNTSMSQHQLHSGIQRKPKPRQQNTLPRARVGMKSQSREIGLVTKKLSPTVHLKKIANPSGARNFSSTRNIHPRWKT